MPVYLYYGDESYLLNREVKQLRQKVVNPAMAALSHKVLKNPHLGTLMEAVGTVSFNLGGDTLIEVQDWQYLEKAASDSDKKIMEDLKSILESVEPTKHVLFSNKKIDRKIAFPKWLSGNKAVTLRECKKLEFWKTDEAAQLILQDAKRQGIELAPKAAVLLVETIGIDLQLLMSEVEKLSIYALGRTIQPEDVAKLSNHNENTFQMLSNWVNNRQRSEVFKILDELLLKQHPIQLFALMQTYVNNAFRLRLWQKMGVHDGEMAERLKKHPFKIKKDLQEFAQVPIDRLANLKEKLVDLEHKMKTGQIDDRLAIEVLLAS